MAPIIYIGRYASDIYRSNLFSGSIVFQGITNRNKGDFSYCYDHKRLVESNEDKEEKTAYIRDRINYFLHYNPETRFMFFAQNYFEEFLPDLDRNLFVGLNEKSINSLLDSKVFSRLWMRNYVPSLHYYVTTYADVSIKRINQVFNKSNAFIIQADNGRGGDGSYIFRNTRELDSFMKNTQTSKVRFSRMIVSPYYEDSIHINQHIIIFDSLIIALQPSIEILVEKECRLHYLGADYAQFNDWDQAVQARKDINKKSVSIAKAMQRAGFKGVAGIDYLYTNNELFFIEINPRFQGSSPLLSWELSKKNLPDLYMLNYRAFTNKPPSNNEKDELERLVLNKKIEKIYGDPERANAATIDKLDGALEEYLYCSPNARLGYRIT